jgi:2'-hydroxyisoflavone reductase
MKLLILGGTQFLGRMLVEVALARGHDVTLFNRGQRNPTLFPELEQLRGNRDPSTSSGLDALKGRVWDAVIDTSGYVPRLVRASAELLADAVGHYTFISSISVFADFETPGMDEHAPVGKLDDETVETIDGKTYGPLKALCEQAAERAMPGRVLVIRPGLIVGMYDPTDRFTYWPVRVARGGAVLAPNGPNTQTQIIDVKDLAEWNLRMVERKQIGVYNATGPAYPLTFGALLDECQRVSGSDATFTWVSEEFLSQQNVQPWLEMTLWVPTKDNAGFSTVNCQKAMRDGLTFRPLADTIRDTLAWNAQLPADRQWRAGHKPEREQQLLQAWRTQQA